MKKLVLLSLICLSWVSCTMEEAIDIMRHKIYPECYVEYGNLILGGNSFDPDSKLIIGTPDANGNTRFYWSAKDTVGLFGIEVAFNEGTQKYEEVQNGSVVNNVAYTAEIAENVFPASAIFTTTSTDSWVAGKTYKIYAYYPYNANNVYGVDSIDLDIPVTQLQHTELSAEMNSKIIGRYGLYWSESPDDQPVTIPTIESGESAHINLTFQPYLSLFEIIFNTKQIILEDDTVFTLYNEDNTPNNPIEAIIFGDAVNHDDSFISVVDGIVNLKEKDEKGYPITNAKASGDDRMTGSEQVSIVAFQKDGTSSIHASFFPLGSKGYALCNTDGSGHQASYKMGVRLRNGEFLTIKANFNLPENFAFERGKRYTFTLPETITNATILFEEISGSGNMRANTYIIPSGTETPYGFIHEAEGNSGYQSGYSAHFFTQNTSYKFTDLVVSAPVIIWQEGYLNDGTYTNDVVDGIIQTVGLFFSLTVKKEIKQGRVLIGALNHAVDGSSNYLPLWHWTIIISEDAVYNPANKNYELPTVTQGGVTFMDRNLGAFDNEGNDINITGGLVYQWGRPIPFRTRNGNETNYPDYQSIQRYYHDTDETNDIAAQYNNISTGGVAAYGSTAHFATGFQTPAGLFKNSYQFASFIQRPYSGTGPYLSTGNENDSYYGAYANYTLMDSEKTRFDPCPFGYRIPTAAEMAAAFPNGTEYTYSTLQGGSVTHDNLTLPLANFISREGTGAGAAVERNRTSTLTDESGVYFWESVYWTTTTPNSSEELGTFSGTSDYRNFSNNLLISTTSEATNVSVRTDIDNFYHRSNTSQITIRKYTAASIRCVKFDEPNSVRLF